MEKFGQMEAATKLFYGIAGVWGIAIAEFIRKPGMEAGIAVCSSALISPH